MGKYKEGDRVKYYPNPKPDTINTKFGVIKSDMKNGNYSILPDGETNKDKTK
ncbi:20546_t:CDS:2, partial [Gigaspora rosea]